VVQDDGLPGQPAATDAVARTRSHMQGEESGRITGPHEARGLHLLRGVRPGGAGAASVIFFLMSREYYRLQLQHLSPNSIALVAIFVHLCEMYVGVRPSVRLFRRFLVLKAASPRPSLIGGHYFQRQTPGHACYITPVSPGRWERWREDWALVQADVHDWLALSSISRPSTTPSKGKTPAWRWVSTSYWIRSSTWPKTA
jgi:hypothetical protein